MKTPLCDVCRFFRTLCVPCRSRLDSGAISWSDVAVSRALTSLGEFPVVLHRSFDLGRLTVVVAEGEADWKELERKMRRKVVPVGPKDGLSAVRAAISPLQLRETVSFSEGRQEKKLAVQRAGLARLGIREEALRAMAAELDVRLSLI